MNKCNYCMYRNECIGELPGDDGKCMAFAVAKEDAPAYERYLAETEAAEKYLREHYFDGLLDD